MVHNTATLSNLEPGASYVVQVVAKGDGLISKDSVAAKKTIKTVALVQLPQPTITQTEIFYREANVAWQNDPRAIGYLVLWRTAKEKSWRSAHVSLGITDYYITGLEPGTSYQVKVVAIGDHFQTRNSSETKYKTIKTKAPATLEQPSIIGYAASKRELGIKWLAVQGAVGYRVEWRAANEKTWRSTPYLLQEAAHDLTELEPNTSYVVRVIAVGDGYETLDSSAKKTNTYKTKPLDVLEQPTITDSEIHQTWVGIRWNPIEDATGYTVNYTRVGTKNTVSVDVDATNDEFNLSTEPGASYNVSVVAKGDGYDTLDSSAKTIKLTASKYDPLHAPAILSYQTSDTAITVNWNRGGYGTFGYDISYKKVGSKVTETVRIKNTQETHNSYTISGLVPGAKYSISITALSYDHPSADSKPTTKTIATSKAPKLLAPTGLSLRLESEDNYFLNWEPVDNASGYVIVMSEVGRPTETKTYYFSPASSASLSVQLNRGSTYNVKIRALGVENYLDSEFSQFTRVYA